MADWQRAILDRVADDYPVDGGRRTEHINPVIERIRAKYPNMPYIDRHSSEPFWVTPYLPERGIMAARNHAKLDKLPVFVRAVLHDPMTKDYCKNCGGSGIVVLVLCERGPFKNPPSTGRSITWFDGDGVNGKGWYTIEKTLSFECPECVSK